MAQIDKFKKSFETLKLFAIHSPKPPEKTLIPVKYLRQDNAVDKKECLRHCEILGNILISNNFRNFSEYNRFLSQSIELLFCLCNNDDPDIRNAINETFDKLISNLIESNSYRFLSEFCRAIMVSSSNRALKLALTKFSEICHRIRPNKYRAFATNLYSSIVSIIIESKDELFQEVLYESICKIYPFLTPYATEKEILDLINAYLLNLSSPSNAIRRYSALSIVILCDSTRKPDYYFNISFNYVSTLISSSKMINKDDLTTGIFMLIKYSFCKVVKCIEKNEHPSIVDSLLRNLSFLYRQLISTLKYSANNILIVSTLEAMCEFFLTMPTKIFQMFNDLSDTEGSEFRGTSSLNYSFKIPAKSADLGHSFDNLNDETIEENQFQKSCIFFNNSSLDINSSVSEAGDNTTYDNDSPDNSEVFFDQDQESEIDTRSISENKGLEFDMMSEVSSLNTASLRCPQSPFDSSVDLVNDNHLSSINFNEVNLGEIYSFKHAAKLICLKYLLRGEPGQILADNEVKVSIKVLTLTCLSNIIQHNPSILFEKITCKNSSQLIQDVFIYLNHSDPNMRGQISLMIGKYLKKVLSYPLSYEDFLSENNIINNEEVSLDNLLLLLKKLLQDSSSITVKHVLISFQFFLPELLLYNEINVVFIFDLIYDLISLNNSSYWLIKVELLKLFSMLSSKHLKYFENVWKSMPDYNEITVSKKFNQSLKYKSISKTILEEIFFPFLFESDHRVRQTSLNCLPKFIENLCLNNYICHNDTINWLMFDSMLPTFNFDLSSKLFNENFPPINVFECPLDAGIQFPNCNVDANSRSFIIESNITYFVKRFLLVLRQKYHSKLSLLSAVNALSALSKAYPPGEHLNGWMIESIEPFKNFHNTVELIYFLIEMLTKNPMFIIDLQSQQNLIELIVDLIEAICLSCFKTLQDHNQNRKEIESSNDIHEMISPDFAKCLETFFLHLYKIIVMFSSINEDNALIFVSFIHNLHTRNTSISSMIKKHSSGFFDMKDKNIWNKDGLKKREAHAYDSCSFRLFEILKNHRYRKSSQGKDSPKTTYLTIVLNSFAKILEFTSASFLCNHLEDILLYLKMIFYSNPYCITCITSKLLKCIFEINYISMFIEVYNLKSVKVERRYSKSNKSIDFNSFYNICFVWPYKFNDIFNQLNVEQMTTDGLKHTSYLSWLRKWTEYKHIKIMNSDVTGLDNRSNPVLLKKFLTNKIKCFEQLVILSMKHYSMTSDRRFQSCILDLLVQLIQFHINYSLLDSDKIFLSLIMKQFEYMENIFDSESFESLMKHIFYFLSTLSREHYIPNDLINTPKIIQLCDNLIANGHQKLAIDGLHIIIDHLFYSDCDSIPTFNAEHRIALDTQKEVILAYCFKLINFDKTFHLLLMILNHYKISCRIKWFDLSTQIIEIIMMKLSNNEIKINSIKYFESFQCLMFSLCPSALAQISSNYLETMFNQFKSSNTNISFKYWLPKILIYLKLILSNLNETDLLSNMDRIKTKLDITNLNAKDSADCFEKINSVDVFAYFLLNLLQKIIMEIDIDLLNNSCCKSNHYNDNNVSSSINTESEMNVYFLRYYQLILAFVFQSGFFPKLTQSASSLIKQSKQDVCLNNEVFDMRIVNDIFLKICKFHPMISISWLNFLCILNYEKLPKILSKNIEKKTTKIMNNSQMNNSTIITLNSEILKRSSLILLCDYLSENLENVEFLSWFIINHLRDIIEHCHEMPIKEFLNTIHRNAVSSGLLLQVISSRCDELFCNAIMANKILNCLERCHNRQNIALIMFLLEKYLCNPKLAIYYKCCKYAESIITSRLMLIYKTNAKSVQSIFNQEDFNNLLKILKHTSYNRLYFTVKMIRIKFYDSVGPNNNKKQLNLIKDPLSQKRIPVPEIDKHWFLKMIENQMSTRQLDDSNVLNSLAKLSDDDIINLMYSEKIAMNNFIFILKFVLKQYLEQHKNKPRTFSTLVDRNLEELAKSIMSIYVCYMQSILDKFPLIHNLYDGKVLEKDDVRLIFSHNKFYQNLILMFLPSFDFFLENFHSFFQNFIPPNDRTNFQQNILHLVTIYSVLNYLLENRQNYQNLLNISRVIENCLNIPSVYLQLCQTRNIHVQLMLINSSHFSFENHFYLEEIHLSTVERFQNELGISLSDYKKMISMFHSLEKENVSSEEIQEHEIPLYSILLRKIVVMFARFPSFNSLIYIPFNLFTTKNEHTWNIMIPENITNVPILASQFLCEIETFKQFMFRVGNLSFMDRRQFEEIWMSLLGVFSEISNRIAPQNRQTEEINDGLILLKLVIMTITNILYDVGINSSNKNDDVQQKNSIASSSSFGMRFDLIQEIIGKKSEYFDRITKLYNEPILNRSFIYKFKSIEECQLNQTIHDNGDADKNGAVDQENNENVITMKKMQTSLHSIDLYSCIQFLIDFYSQQIKPCSNKAIYFPVVTEIAKSTFYISEIFVSQNHHRRVLDLYNDLQKIVENYDDEILNQFVSTGFCKLNSMSPTNLTTADQDNIEKHKKILIERNFKEFFLPTRIYAIHGVKYLVESNLIKSKDLYPLLDYLVKHLNTEHIIPSSYCKEYVDELVYISFLLLDSYSEVINNVEYGKKIMKGLIKLTSKDINIRISRTLNHCFEKLILNGKISQDDANSLRNIVLKRINITTNLSYTVYMLNMIVRTSYFVGSINFDLEHEDDESDELFKTMEKLSIIFEPLKWCNSLEANVICQVLGYFLSEFFPAQDILNKCIGEFLSKQQNHYKYLINILHIIYSRLQVDCQQNDTAQDWVILSLSSFTQLVPISHALWALTCFLICASQNHWTRSCYYYFQNRFGKFSLQDKEAFFSICNNFYNEIKSDDNKMFFIKTFQKAACQPNSPYIEVLQYLCDNI